MRQYIWVLASALAVLPPGASAKLCGDDVAGRDVPCECGDIVASDLALDDDPVASTRCPDNALIVRAIRAPRGVTIDLRGRTLSGSGGGHGLWIVHGGPGGARVVSTGAPGAITGFRDGIATTNPRALALIENVVASAVLEDGIRVRGTGYEIRNTQVWDAGRNGFSLGGRGFRVRGTAAVGSRGSGYLVSGLAGELGVPGDGIVAADSGEDGVRLHGRGHQVQDCVAVGGRRNGVRLGAGYVALRGCRLADNRGAGLKGRGRSIELADNLAFGNGESGLAVSGPYLADQGGNDGIGNGAEATQHAVQCEIGGTPCAR
jgi:hypothetical protein